MDLPIALSILIASGQIPREFVEGRLFAGELGLDGKVHPVRGTVPYTLAAKHEGLDFVGSIACADASYVPNAGQLGMESLADARTGRIHSLPLPAPDKGQADGNTPRDFKDVSGNEHAKRALQIAAAGGHSILLVGPPGSGKTMLATRVPSILPLMSTEERVQTATIQSAAGVPVDLATFGARPFRAPHHSMNLPGMVGGGNPVRPGEASLAHNGVLFLDEIQKFSPMVLQGLRQPQESGLVRITRADGSAEMPAKPAVTIAAASPCPCGHYGDASRECTCSARQVSEYQNRLAGPLADLIDIRVDVRRPSPSELLNGPEGVSSAQLREGVVRARKFAERDDRLYNSANPLVDAVRHCSMGSETLKLFDRAATERNMSNADVIRVLKVARTIADLEESYKVEKGHVIEALALVPRFGNR